MKDVDLDRFYENAKKHVFASGFAEECRYYGEFSTDSVTEQIFLTEYSWVVFNSGFREDIIRGRFNYLSLCFYDWRSAQQIISTAEECIELAISCFRNHAKLQGIVNGAKIFLSKGGMDWVSNILTKEHYNELELLPFIGPITSKHLAKNLGVPIVKPDRHLTKFADSVGRNIESICEDISDNLKFVDTVLWRYFAIAT